MFLDFLKVKNLRNFRTLLDLAWLDGQNNERVTEIEILFVSSYS